MKMGKDKLKRFSQNETFNNLFQPQIEYNTKNHALKGAWYQKFNNDNPIILELGCGRGEYTVELAKKFLDNNFIGIDIKGARLWRGAKSAIEEDITNVKFLRTKIDFIEKFFKPEEVDEIWLTFSDPQPKKPRKRLTSPLFIDRYKNVLKKDGIIHLKTDSELLYQYTIDEINANNYPIIHNNPDIYSSFNSIAEELKNVLSIKTFYEDKWLELNKSIKYLSFRINP
jgi:tRNA (guanine-N7-)-methyltransferase